MEHGSFQMMKSINRSIVLNKIRESNTISRAEIAKVTKLTPPTVGSIVKELIEEGIVQESAFGISNGGRRPKTLYINENCYYIIGIDAGPVSIDGILIDLSGKIISRETRPLVDVHENEQFLEILETVINILFSSVTNKGNIYGIGIAMQGAINIDTGESLIAPNLGLRNIPIQKKLEKLFNVLVKVENDARAMAIGESWFGKREPYNSLMAINIGRGVGAGIVIDGKIYHGIKGVAGEIGHMTIDINGELCDCGNFGCLQAYVTGAAIVHRALKLNPDMPVKSAEDLYQLAIENDKTAVRIFHETGEIIGIGLTNLIHIINPERIILGGGVMKAGRFILPAIQKAIQRHALTEDAKNTKVVITPFGDDATLLGAAALLLDKVFQ